MPKSAELIEHAAEGPNVTLVVVWLLFAELWRKIIRRSDDRVGHILRLIQQFGDTQVANFDLIFFPEEHIRRLDVTMQNLVLMQVP